ncbi:hypothetical protein TWF696_007374 [Orbilia brochopaga]|uniref:DUF3020 domain-containing protein n=1 Tax=Orbilia brochopaga TaxID=3140254 RepID=A0AAV9UV14_9PEZI
MTGGTDNHESLPPPTGAIVAPPPAEVVVAAAVTDDDVSRKRKVSPAADDAQQSPQKRQRVDMTPPPRPTSTDSYSRAPHPRFASLPPTDTPSIILPPPMPAVQTQPKQDLIPSPDAFLTLEQPAMSSPQPQNPYSEQPPRDNMQFSATDLPPDDENIAGWLARQVRDSATTQHNLGISSGNAGHSPDAGGVESDPETRAERERVRAENRERKKKWREENSDRNKDNDLRGRVSRRANKLFGAENSDKKRLWMESEFNRRKTKREFKTQLKKNETPGSSCWNANDDFTDNPSQVMAGVLTNQEGAAENFRNWLENGDVDYETWRTACQEIWGNPGLRECLEVHLPPMGAGSNAGGQGAKGDGKDADDGLTSKFDAAFDAIIGRPPRKSTTMPPPLIPQAANEAAEMGTAETTPNEVENLGIEAALPQVDAAAEADAGAESLDQLTEEDLQQMIEAGGLSMEEIAALEAALKDENFGQEDPQMVEARLGTEAAAEATDIAMQDPHADHADISDLQLQLDMMSPSTRDAFLTTFIGQSDAVDEMRLDDAAAVEPAAEQPDATDEAAAADGTGEDASVLDLLASAGINLDDLSEEQLQKFINAVSGDGDIDEVLASIQTEQGTSQTATDPGESTAALPQPTQDTLADDNMELNNLDEDAGNSGEDFDDSDEIDLTPDIMRIILEQSNYSSLLGGKSLDSLTTDMAGDAHTIQPKPSVPAPPPQPSPARTPARQTYPMIQQQRQQQQQLQQQQQQQQQQQYSYPSRPYSGNYTYAYDRRPEVQILPPGYSAHQRPPVPSQQPRYPDLTHLIKPPVYKAAQQGDGATVPRNLLAKFLEFKLPIPKFLSRGVPPVDAAKREEEARNVRAYGFPPMASELLKL